jgi:hypothetical protein
MSLLKALTVGTELETTPVCEMCGIVQSVGDTDWQHHVDTVEEVEISWANGDEGVVTRFQTRMYFDLCPACAIPQEASLTSNYELLSLEA